MLSEDLINSDEKSGSRVKDESELDTLILLKPGERGVIKELQCTGQTRRRFLDLGLVSGAVIEVVMKSFRGDPVAYRIGGTLLAIRLKDARKIIIKRKT